MRHLYSILYTCAMLLALPYFLVLGLFRGKYLKSARQRFGFIEASSERPSCWVHCVSVGEFLAAKPLIRRIQEEYPQLPLFLSTTTITGQQLASAFLPGKSFYFPFDWKLTVRRALRRIRPGLVVVLETEIWPNFLWECRSRKIAVVLVNGRLSDRSFGRYMRLRSFLPAFQESLMQTTLDAERMRSLTGHPDSVQVMGNLKFDFHPAQMKAELRQLLEQWKKDSLVWIAGSTMPGEEERLMEAQRAARKKYPLKLLIAPRHPERFEEVAQLIARAGLSLTRRSRPGSEDAEVFLLDTIGELAASYEFADVVFIGGTLNDHGGHNPIEASYFGKPVLAGPHYSNFRSIFQEFIAREALLIAEDTTTALDSLLSDAARRERMGNAAKSLLAANAGATEVAMRTLRSYLDTL